METRGDDLIHSFSDNSAGLTKREHFAITIMQGLMANKTKPKYIIGTTRYDISNDIEIAIQGADELLDVLNDPNF